MAYKLTGLTKGLLALIGVGIIGSVGWNFFLKDKLGKDAGNKPTASTSAPAARSGSGPLGSASNPLRISIVSFHGYAPALVANGNSLTTQPGSIYAHQGINVEVVINDDIPTLTTLFEAKAAQCAWRKNHLRSRGIERRTSRHSIDEANRQRFTR